MSDAFSALLEMGFSKTKAQRALSETGNSSVEAAMEWLLVHNEDPEPEALDMTDVKSQPASGDTTADANEVPTENEVDLEVPQPKSLKCDVCGKKFKSEVEVEFHAVKSGHESFSESTEEVTPLTDEEKKERLKKMEEKIRERRLQREEQTKKEEIEKEKARRKVGQEVAQTRQRLHEEEMKKLAEQTRREKAEKIQARQRVLEEIERDKQARREKFSNTNTSSVREPDASVPPAEVAPVSATKKDYAECRLQIRLTNGQTLTHVFGPNEELAAVRLYVQLNRTDGSQPFTLMTNFPKKVFTEEDMEKPLGILGLVPSAVLIVTKVPGGS